MKPTGIPFLPKFSSTRFAYLAVVLLVSTWSSLSAQGPAIEITPTGGFQFGGKINFFEGRFRIQNSGNYGVTLGVELAPYSWGEIYWTQMSSQANFESFDPRFDDEDFRVLVNYIQVGATRAFPVSDVFHPFGSFTVGTAWMDSREGNNQDYWSFAATIGGGAKIMLSDRIGIRLQGRLLLPMNFAGAGFFCGIGGGGSSCGITLNSFATIVQGDFTGGLIIRLGNY
ncbi:outer membrane beta-barrel protein [Pontibacter sp. G13]|uniref:outer membrane beta-barrel protein n=1 Tax=Pontibacter sp. G13 TaxID=3074898 RepID=UPI00288AD373|nr:outer membrane beta-barrel protein [Pontibacter sp. G13]WNJ19552.1 outer membrane beta-barrel protein [Pontibacter sp. G13]